MAIAGFVPPDLGVRVDTRVGVPGVHGRSTEGRRVGRSGHGAGAGVVLEVHEDGAHHHRLRRAVLRTAAARCRWSCRPSPSNRAEPVAPPSLRRRPDPVPVAAPVPSSARPSPANRPCRRRRAARAGRRYGGAARTRAVESAGAARAGRCRPSPCSPAAARRPAAGAGFRAPAPPINATTVLEASAQRRKVTVIFMWAPS